MREVEMHVVKKMLNEGCKNVYKKKRKMRIIRAYETRKRKMRKIKKYQLLYAKWKMRE